MLTLLAAFLLSGPDSLITVHVPAPLEATQQRVIRAVTAEGLALAA